MKVKYIDRENPFVSGGVSRYKVEHETNHYYVVRCNDVALDYYRKHPTDKDGSLVRRRGADKWEQLATLRIVEDA